MTKVFPQPKFYLFFLVISVMISCQQSPKKEKSKTDIKPKTESAALNQEDQLIKLITDLDEVKRKSIQVKKESNGKRHLSTYMDDSPAADDTDYWMKVAEDNGDSYVTYYTFAVDKKTRQIRFYDVLQDSLISLNQWRKTTVSEDR